MNDFKKLNKELSENIHLKNVLTEYALPNSEEIHSMICGYSFSRELGDEIALFETAESIDYFKYEKELCKLKKSKT